MISKRLIGRKISAGEISNVNKQLIEARKSGEPGIIGLSANGAVEFICRNLIYNGFNRKGSGDLAAASFVTWLCSFFSFLVLGRLISFRGRTFGTRTKTMFSVRGQGSFEPGDFSFQLQDSDFLSPQLFGQKKYHGLYFRMNRITGCPDEGYTLV